MAKVKFVLLMPLTYNDGSQVPKNVMDRIEDELFVLAGGFNIAGTGKGASRMRNGSKQIDETLQMWVVVDEERTGIEGTSCWLWRDTRPGVNIFRTHNQHRRVRQIDSSLEDKAMTKEKNILDSAREVAQSVETWADLSNALFDPEVGLVARAFPTRQEREAFLRTKEYRAIRQLIDSARSEPASSQEQHRQRAESSSSACPRHSTPPSMPRLPKKA